VITLYGIGTLSSYARFSKNTGLKKNIDYRGFRYPPEIISNAVWLYYRFTFSFRDIEDLMAERGVIVSYEAIRLWCIRFGPAYARRLRKKQHRFGDHWYLDEI